MVETIHSHEDAKVRRGWRRIKKINPRQALLILLAVCLIGSGVWFVRDRSIKSKQQAETKFQNTVTKADTIPAHQRGDAIKLLEQEYKNTKDPAQQYAFAVRTGTQYYYEKKWVEALRWFELAQKTSQPGSDGVSLYIAVSAENLGDKQKAIAAYRQYISILEKQPGPYAQTQVEQYKAKIKGLGG